MNHQLTATFAPLPNTLRAQESVMLVEELAGHEDVRVTSGQLQAIAVRFRAELEASLRRGGGAIVATVNDGILSVCVEQILTAAEHQLMRRAKGRAFFQHYVEKLAEQIAPNLLRHVEHILPCSATYMRVRVDSEQDSILFTFGLHPRPCAHLAIDSVEYQPLASA